MLQHPVMHTTRAPTEALPRRLHKFLCDSAGLSRSLGEEAWRQGRVSVTTPNGVCRHDHPLDALVYDGDGIRLDGRELAIRPPGTYVALHKPAGVITAVRDMHGRDHLGPWLEGLAQGTFPVGRLDEETTGLLLLMDDGDLAFMLLRPEFHVAKEYHLQIRGPVEQDDSRLAALRQGVELGDGPARALSTRVLTAGPEHSLVSMEIDEGRNRQVRRMCRKVRLWLEHLHRDRVGPIALGDLPCGERRALQPGEVQSLWQAVGGRERVYLRQWRALKRTAEDARAHGEPIARLEAWLEEHPWQPAQEVT